MNATRRGKVSSPKQLVFEDTMKPKARIDVKGLTSKHVPVLDGRNSAFIGQPRVVAATLVVSIPDVVRCLFAGNRK